AVAADVTADRSAFDQRQPRLDVAEPVELADDRVRDVEQDAALGARLQRRDEFDLLRRGMLRRRRVLDEQRLADRVLIARDALAHEVEIVVVALLAGAHEGAADLKSAEMIGDREWLQHVDVAAQASEI